MGRTEDLFFQGHDLAEVGDGFVILALAISRVGEPVPAPKCIRMLGAHAALARFDYGAQGVLGFAVGALIDEKIADGVLDVGPLLGVTLAIGQLLCGAEIFQGGLKLDALLRGESGQLAAARNAIGIKADFDPNPSCRGKLAAELRALERVLGRRGRRRLDSLRSERAVTSPAARAA